MNRETRHHYSDPLDVIWIECARQFGIAIERSSDVFAFYDGAGLLNIGTADTLDPDDSLAQMIFHELCHFLIQGPESIRLPDWGLDNDNPQDIVREHACLHLQAKLADNFGLRNFFATTTDFRTYFNQLDQDPLQNDCEAAEIAKAGFARATHGPNANALQAALQATSQILNITRPFADKRSLWTV